MSDKSVTERIQAGDFKTKLPYDTKRNNPAVFKAFMDDQARLENEFWRAVEEENGTTSLPENVKSKLRSLAWEHGHSAGYSEVNYYYSDFCELALLAFEEGKKVAAEPHREHLRYLQSLRDSSK